MALLLRPGDPLPALPTPNGRLDLSPWRGNFVTVLVGQPPPQAPLPCVSMEDSELGHLAARRLGADFVNGIPQPLLVLLDPAGVVVQSWAGQDARELLELAAETVKSLGERSR